MTLTKASFLILLLFGSIASNSVWADRGHSRHGARAGFYFGGSVLGPWNSPYPYFYGPSYYGPSYGYPTVVAVPASPPVYIEQGSSQEATQNANFWYYCNDPDGYYPYVKHCPVGWQQVVPRPSPQP